MTNILIRRLINCGYDPENARVICLLYLNTLSLAVLDEELKRIEEGEKSKVDELQPQLNR